MRKLADHNEAACQRDCDGGEYAYHLRYSRKRLEFHPQSYLSGAIATYARDLPETRVEHACLNPTKGMAVEGVEQFYPELCFHALAHPEGLAQADVFVAAPKVANFERECGGACERTKSISDFSQRLEKGRRYSQWKALNHPSPPEGLSLPKTLYLRIFFRRAAAS